MKVKGVVKQWRYPEASERQLGRSLQDITDQIVKQAKSKLRKMRFDATDEEINEAEQELSDFAMVLILALFASLPAMAMRIYKFNSAQFVSLAKSTGGKNNESVIVLSALGANGSESWYREKSNQWISTAQASITKLVDDIVKDWLVNVRTANMQGKTKAQVEEIAANRYKRYSGWSLNRARGIVSTWNSVLMRTRLTFAGVTHYFWHGKLDERERLAHVKLEGVRIALDSDHVFPGEPYGCRCWATPDWSTKQV